MSEVVHTSYDLYTEERVGDLGRSLAVRLILYTQMQMTDYLVELFTNDYRDNI